jgi:Ca-activated chloride channel family protein
MSLLRFAVGTAAAAFAFALAPSGLMPAGSPWGGALAAGSPSEAAPAAEQAPQQPTFRSKPNVTVPLFVTVLDPERRLVPGLVKEDFSVFDNEKPVELALFDNEVRPITVVVMLDTSGSMTLNIEFLKQAAEQFVIRLLPADKARVGAFNDKVEIDASFTNDRDALISSIKELDYGNGTRLWDGVDVSLDALEGVEGRKVIVVFTDGDDTASKTSSGKVLERARLSEVMIYAIGLESVYQPMGQPKVRTRPDRGLRRLSDETGGGYYEFKKTEELGPAFTRVAQELHSQYLLGFTPTQLDGKVHKLEVKMTRPGMTARARRSYVATPEPGAAPSTRP